eukprot:TRINITY_DN18154_c0_g1_i1.p1 TRINITY_DN18154_c0_g1~~TRINITY_DN18154_c0_g1_i1.p1  ORF type:complete len:212 (+),score=49.87 TRINITY_DN18154_c0_g1_i1:56-691(+)
MTSVITAAGEVKKRCDCSCHDETKIADLVFRVKFVTDGHSPTVSVHVHPECTVKEFKDHLVQVCVSGTSDVKLQNRIHSMDLFFNAQRVREDQVVKYVVQQHYCSRKPPLATHRQLHLGDMGDFELPVVCAHVDPCRCSTCRRKMNQIVGMHNKLMWKFCFDQCCEAKKGRLEQEQRQDDAEEHFQDMEVEELQGLFEQLLNEAKKFKNMK